MSRKFKSKSKGYPNKNVKCKQDGKTAQSARDQRSTDPAIEQIFLPVNRKYSISPGDRRYMLKMFSKKVSPKIIFHHYAPANVPY